MWRDGTLRLLAHHPRALPLSYQHQKVDGGRNQTADSELFRLHPLLRVLKVWPLAEPVANRMPLASISRALYPLSYPITKYFNTKQQGVKQSPLTPVLRFQIVSLVRLVLKRERALL